MGSLCNMFNVPVLIVLAYGFLFHTISTQDVIYEVIGVGLHDVPCNISSNTTELNLNDNKISLVDQDCLADLQSLKKLTLASNKLTSFPNLTVVGNSLKVLHLGGNKIPNISLELLQNLTILRDLSLANNLLTAFPDLSPIGNTLEILKLSGNDLGEIPEHLLENLKVIKFLRLRETGLVEFPNLSSISSTLKNFVFDENVLQNGTISDDSMSALSSVEELELEAIGLTTFPNLLSMCQNVVSINVKANQLSFIDPESLRNCVNLKQFFAGSNNFEEFPNLTYVGDTLEEVNVFKNGMSTFNSDIFQTFSALVSLYLFSNELTEFPNVTYVGQTLFRLQLQDNHITHIPAEILDSMVGIGLLWLGQNQLTEIPDVPGPGETLTFLSLSENNLRKFPSLVNMGCSLQTLILEKNDITYILRTDLIGLDAIKHLKLDDTLLMTLPDFSSVVDTLESLELRNVPLAVIPGVNAAYLGQVSSVRIGSTNSISIPSLCPQTGVAMSLSGNIDLCHCSMVWLKLASEAGFQVDVEDQNCTSTGKMWSAATPEELLTNCALDAAVGCKRGIKI